MNEIICPSCKKAFKVDEVEFPLNYNNGSKKFIEAIDSINKSISKLQKFKEA